MSAQDLWETEAPRKLQERKIYTANEATQEVAQ